MNWCKIVEEYRLAYRTYLCFLKNVEYDHSWTIERLKEFFQFNLPEEGSLLISGTWDAYTEYDNRRLYDFFDSNEIYIEVSPQYNFGDEKVNPKYWEWTIHNGELFSQGYHNEGDYSDTRKTAETKAFIKAFELLQNKLYDRNDTREN